MQKYFNNVAVANGAGQLRAISGALITVTNLDGSAAVIYANNGGAPLTDPLLSDDKGYFEFYAADGRYTLTITKVGITTISIADVLLEDPIDAPYTQGGAGSVTRNVQDKLRESVSLKDFGAVGDGIVDDTAAILAAKAYAIANLPMRIIAPKGTYLYTDIGNWAYSGLSLEGESHRSTFFKCTGSGSAFVVNAFQPGFTGNDATAPYIQSMNVKNITFKGNAVTPIIVEIQGISRCAWENVFAADGEPTAGIAFRMHGTQLNSFYNVGCSTNIAAMTSVPYEGIRLAAGTRNGVSVGNSSNNTFVNAYCEGLSIGIRISGGDNNTFMSGASEANSVYDLLIAAGSRYNVLIAMGFESVPVTANISDGGTYTKYLNCYANKSVLLAGTGIEISGGFFHRIEMQAAANRCRVYSVHVKNWESTFPGTGGFVISGSATSPEWRNIYDINAAAYVYPHRSRTGITVGASPFQWLNNTGQYVEVVIQTGTISQVLVRRNSVGGVGGDTWLNPITVPNKHLLAPNDILEVSYSVSPGMSYVPHNGFQG